MSNYDIKYYMAGEKNMGVYAVICEFNPFHNGHALLINKIKESDRDAKIVAVMSGNFVERGDAAVIDKYSRAEMALRCGCNLVLELPSPWCFSGAEFFARGGVHIADAIGVTDYLAFGSESGDIESLKLCAERISSAEFEEKLTAMRATHPNLNTAELREWTYTALYGKSKHFAGSNDLLALEYISAIHELSAKITPVTVKREGGEYNCKNLEKICSATAIRKALNEGADLMGFMPDAALSILRRELESGRIYSLSRLDTAVSAVLRTASPKSLSDIMEISGGMENRLISASDKARTIEEIIAAAKQKRYSDSRLRRAIISALIGVKTADAEALPCFTVLLGADEIGRELLSKCRRKSGIAILSKPSDEKTLTGNALAQYLLHKKSDRVAELCCIGEPERSAPVML